MSDTFVSWAMALLHSNDRAIMGETLKTIDAYLKIAIAEKEANPDEGLILTWDSASHRLAKAKITTKQATHLGTKTIVENLHSDVYGEMAAALFVGTFQGVPDVRQSMPEVQTDRKRREYGGEQNKKRWKR